MLSLLSILHLCVLIGVALRIFSRRNASGTAVGWLLMVILLPAVGALMYLLIGERRLGKKWMQRESDPHPFSTFTCDLCGYQPFSLGVHE